MSTDMFYVAVVFCFARNILFYVFTLFCQSFFCTWPTYSGFIFILKFGEKAAEPKPLIMTLVSKLQDYRITQTAMYNK